MIERIKHRLHQLAPKSSFARGVVALVAGAAGSQILLILAAPLLTRLYSPNDFGILTVYASLLAFLSVISSLRFELAIPLPESDQEAANILALSFICLAGTTMLATLVIYFLGSIVTQTLGVSNLEPYLWLLPIGLLLIGAYTIFSNWALRTKQFSKIASTRVNQSLVTILIQVTAFKAGPVALLLGQIAGQSIGATSLGKVVFSFKDIKFSSWPELAAVARKYQRFPIYTTWSGLINVAGNQLPPLMFSAIFGIGVAGLYGLAHRVLTLPVSVIGSAIGNVFLSNAPAARREERLPELVSELQDRLINIGLPPASMLLLTGPYLFVRLFGEEWHQAGVFAQWLAISIFAGFVASPLSTIFVVVERQDIGLMLQVTLFLARLMGILVGAWLGDALAAVALFSIGSLVGYAMYVFAAAKLIGLSSISIIKSLVKSGANSIFILGPLLIAFTVEVSRSVLWAAILISLALLLTHYIRLMRTGALKDKRL